MYLIMSNLFRFCPKKKRHDEVDSMGSIDDIFKDQRKTRSPLYDELSIPFIDASLPPTPKVGRGGNPLEILLGKIDGSRTSLNGETWTVMFIPLIVNKFNPFQIPRSLGIRKLRLILDRPRHRTRVTEENHQ